MNIVETFVAGLIFLFWVAVVMLLFLLAYVSISAVVGVLLGGIAFVVVWTFQLLGEVVAWLL